MKEKRGRERDYVHKRGNWIDEEEKEEDTEWSERDKKENSKEDEDRKT